MNRSTKLSFIIFLIENKWIKSLRSRAKTFSSRNWHVCTPNEKNGIVQSWDDSHKIILCFVLFCFVKDR